RHELATVALLAMVYSPSMRQVGHAASASGVDVVTGFKTVSCSCSGCSKPRVLTQYPCQLALICADQPPLPHYMALQRVKHLLLWGACGEAQRGVQRIEGEAIVVGTRGWAGAGIAGPAGTVPSLEGAAVEALRRRHCLGQTARGGGQVEEHPVREG